MSMLRSMALEDQNEAKQRREAGQRGAASTSSDNAVQRAESNGRGASTPTRQATRKVEGSGGAGLSQSTGSGRLLEPGHGPEYSHDTRSHRGKRTSDWEHSSQIETSRPAETRSPRVVLDQGLPPRQAQTAQNVRVRKEPKPRQTAQASLPPERSQGGGRSQINLPGPMPTRSGRLTSERSESVKRPEPPKPMVEAQHRKKKFVSNARHQNNTEDRT